MKVAAVLRAWTTALGLFCMPGIAAVPPGVIPDAAHSVPGGRAVEVVVAQSEIKADINPSNLVTATGGGLIGGLLQASQNASRTKKAEAAIEPVRVALGDFDVDALAFKTTEAALAQSPWINPVAIASSKDSSLLGESAALDKSGAGQLLFVDYSYDLSPDLATVRVVAKLQLANRVVPPEAAAKPETRLLPRNLAYAQGVTSIVTMPLISADVNGNAALWSADRGKAARAALRLAFAGIERLIPRTLALTADDVKAMSSRNKPKSIRGGFGGRVQEEGPSSALLWSEGFILFETLPSAQAAGA